MTVQPKVHQIEVGATTPDFTAPCFPGESFTLREHRGSWIVLYFYPRDLTSGCTAEACDFRDNILSFMSLNALVVGISPDSIKKHESFVEKHQLPFTLVADEDRSISALYDVYKEKTMYGRKVMGIERSTFIIDPAGRIARRWTSVKVKGHVGQVHEALTTLASA